MDSKLAKYTGLRPAQFILLASDTLAMQVVLLTVILFRAMLGGVNIELYGIMSALLFSSPIFSLFFGAGQIPLPPAHREVKHIFLMITMVYLLILLFLFVTQVSVDYSRSILLFSWMASIVAVPVVRGMVRRRLCRKPWWGCPTIFLQDEKICKEIWDEMLLFPERGLKPVAYLNIDRNDAHYEQKILEIQKSYIRPIFVWCGVNDEVVEEANFFEKVSRLCKSMLYMPCSKLKIKKFSLVPRIIGTSMGFVVRQNLTDERRLGVKRLLDLILGSFIMIFALPIGCIIAISIMVTTKSSPIYTQKRRGQGGKKVLIYKFRTMWPNAEELLKQYLKDSPEMQKEWDVNTKLSHDPRITKVGHFLRRSSLDELPQLINVMLGNMSLVGPRPILEEEVERYGDVFINYSEVKPGITGLWQVSGRNLTTYEQRLWYVNYYVTNWSLWMDLWILARTLPVVIRGHGAV